MKFIKEVPGLAQAMAEHNAQIIFERWELEWRKITCLRANNLATSEEVLKVWFDGFDEASVFHCYDEFKALCKEHGLIKGGDTDEA